MSVFRKAPAEQSEAGTETPLISVLIPARNESAGIERTIRAVLDSSYPALEVCVLDDHSTDETFQIVEQIAAKDDRVQLASAPELPKGWCGKQHACWELSKRAKGSHLLFLDADVRLDRSAIERSFNLFKASEVDLLSCFPRQETGTLLERLLIPLIHFVLLGFLSLRQMRARTEPAFAAGCGQFFLTSAVAYQESGGHQEIRESLHDGLRLPRLYRAAGLKTDLFDGTDLAVVRMYKNGSEVWSGLQKNACEGLGSPKLIGPISVILILGQVMPFILVGCYASSGMSWVFALSLIAALFGILIRFVAALRFRQSLFGAVLHPIGITLLLIIQWTALIRLLQGQGGNWKGRSYSASSVVTNER